MHWTTGEPIFDLDVVKAELAMAEPQESEWDSDTKEKWVYLGTVFGLMPSGKFYTPWANSNVEECGTCDGCGVVDSPLSEVLPGPSLALLHGLAKSLDWKLRELAMRFYGSAYKGEWPKPISQVLEHTGAIAMMLQDKVECETCGGLGSEEAHLDELWREQAEEELAKIGASLMSGEGDPCDLFAVLPVDAEPKDAEPEDAEPEEDE